MKGKSPTTILAWLAGFLTMSLSTTTVTAEDDFLRKVLIPGEDWQLVGEGYLFSEGTAVNRDGSVYFNDLRASKGYWIEGDRVIEWCPDTRGGIGQTYGTDGRTLYTLSWEFPEVTRTEADGRRSIFASKTKGNDIVCHPSGDFYYTNPPGVGVENPEPSRIWLLRATGDLLQVHEGIRFTNGICVSPDGKTLYVNDWLGVHVYQFEIRKDGRLGPPDPFIVLEKPDDLDFAGSDGMRVDTEGRLWVTTRLGIQIFDPTGRPLGILKGPEQRQSHLVFGGPEFDTLYLTTVKAIYKRKLRVRGVNPWDRAISADH